MARKRRDEYTTENEWQAELARTRETLPAAPSAFGGGISRGAGASRSFDLPEAPTTAPAVPQGGMPPAGFVRGVVENNPVMAPITERATAIDNAPRLFVDSDGRARAGYNMGQEGRELGLVPADRGGVPEGMQMVPVTGLSQGTMSIGRDLAAGPPAPVALRPEELPVAPGVANERYGRAADAMGGFVAPPMNAREQARAGDMDATRAARWDQRGPTSQADRNVQTIRSQGAALDALTRKTDEQVRLAQGTPQVEASPAGVGAWDPVNKRVVTEMRPADPGSVPTMEERLAKVAQAYKVMSGGDIDPLVMSQITNQPDPVKRKELLDAATQGNPQMATMLANLMTGIMGGGATPAPGAGGGQPGPGVNAAAQNGTRPTGGVADKYRRKAT